ncbi:MAG: hypothetical protein DRP55_03075 [Spirochaetes bacterium]|nr:hypothetical protein [Deltaproteobacteria bacterium]RKY02273.1 MAG: hypothetical protein DRP55_03075 [Spirochaetota bacterium]
MVFQLKDIAIAIGIFSTLTALLLKMKTMKDHYVSKEMCSKTHNNTDKSIARIDHNISKIWDRIDDISRGISRIEGYLNGKKL